LVFHSSTHDSCLYVLFGTLADPNDGTQHSERKRRPAVNRPSPVHVTALRAGFTALQTVAFHLLRTKPKKWQSNR